MCTRKMCPLSSPFPFNLFYSYLLFHVFISYCFINLPLVAGDAWNPVRHRTEDAFFRAGTHERSMSVEEMEKKIDVIRTRRHEIVWNSVHPAVSEKISNYSGVNHHDGTPMKKRPNILFLFADDLGFGDLSVPPFRTPYDEKKFPCVEGGILTPQLERMAREGVRMTNFHSAAPVCSPSRTSAMTGLYSWRMTAMNAFELGRDPSQRNGFLPQIPTTAEILRENGYFTVHSGKWHLGGMREEQRVDRAYHDRCSRPSPNQHGFEEYISELDGPESPRYTFLLGCSCLHSKGHRHLIKDDVPVPIIENPNAENVLSDREAQDAIDYMKKWKETNPNQPWFMQVWFNAPHGPWEVLKSGEQYYNEKYNVQSSYWEKYQCHYEGKAHPLYAQNWQYKTMVSAMDRSIGLILDALKELQIEEETLVVFTSDNGHEMGAGDPGFFREGKRSLMEGGVRVPAIWKWKGTLPENTYSTYFGGMTDLLPTFLQAAHIPKPTTLHVDGISLLPVLTKASPIQNIEEVYNFQGRKHVPGEKEIQLRYFPQHHKLYDTLYSGVVPTTLNDENKPNSNNNHDGGSVDPLSAFLFHEGFRHILIDEIATPMTRVFLWHKDTDPYSRDERMQSAGYYDQVKLISSGARGCLDRIFDMKLDPIEHFNLFSGGCVIDFNTKPDISKIRTVLNTNVVHNHHCNTHHQSTTKYRKLMDVLNKYINAGNPLKYHQNEIKTCDDFYSYYYAIKIYIIWNKLVPFVRTGNLGHQKYMREDNAICKIPIASEIKGFDFNGVCPNDGQPCSMPEF